MVLENLKMALYHSVHNIMWHYEFKGQILHRGPWRRTYNLKHQVLLLVLCKVASFGYNIQLDLEEALSSIHQVICMAVEKKNS